jgi:hypothetical protein
MHSPLMKTFSAALVCRRHAFASVQDAAEHSCADLYSG